LYVAFVSSGVPGVKSGVNALWIERGECLVDLGGDEVEPLLQAVARHRAGSWCQLAGRCLVGDVLHDGWPFAQALAVVELQQRDIALGVDAVVVGPVLQLVRLGAGQHRLEGQAGLGENDVGRQRTRAGAVVKLHGG
jgi:hypothetical protein